MVFTHYITFVSADANKTFVSRQDYRRQYTTHSESTRPIHIPVYEKIGDYNYLKKLQLCEKCFFKRCKCASSYSCGCPSIC